MYRTAIAYTILLLSIFVLPRCSGPDFILDPSTNSKIYSEVDASGTHYVTYFKVLNFSDFPGQFSITGPLSNVKFVSPVPFVVPPNASVDAKFEIINFNPATPCPAPCIIDEIKLRGTWSLYNKPGYFVDKNASIQWSTPIARVNCWVPTEPPGDPGNYHSSRLCAYLTPSQGGVGGQFLKWPQVGEVYNPNSFHIKVFVNFREPATYHCYKSGKGQDLNFGWKDLAPYASFNYGDSIRTNFTSSCLVANPDAYISIYQPDGLFTSKDVAIRWIAIGVTLR